MASSSELKCPACGEGFNYAAPERGGGTPSDGDLGVCSFCSALIRITEEFSLSGVGYVLSAVSPEEAEDFSEEDLAAIESIKDRARLGLTKPSLFDEILNSRLEQVEAYLRGTASCGCCFCKGGDGLNCYRRRSS